MATFYILWDDNKNEWINIGVINNNNLKIFFFNVAGIILHCVNYVNVFEIRRKSKETPE